MIEILINSLPIYLSILVGYLLKSRGFLGENSKQVVATIIFKVVSPFLILSMLYGFQLKKSDLSLVLYTVVILAFCGLALYFYNKLTKQPRKTAGSILVTGIGFAVGSFAYPFVIKNFSPEIFQEVVFVDIIHFTIFLLVGYMIAIKYGDKGELNRETLIRITVKDPIILTIVFTFVVILFDIKLPQIVLDISDFFAQSFAFLITLLLGLSLKLPSLKGLVRISQVFIVRTLSAIAIILIIVLIFNPSSTTEKVLFLTFLTPFGTMSIIFAEEQGTDSEILAQLAIFSLLAMLLIYPLVLFFLR